VWKQGNTPTKIAGPKAFEIKEKNMDYRGKPPYVKGKKKGKDHEMREGSNKGDSYDLEGGVRNIRSKHHDPKQVTSEERVSDAGRGKWKLGNVS